MTTRERLQDMMADAGYPLSTGPIGAQGYWRINAKYDDTTVCWEGFTTGRQHVVSYDTMTNCVRRGFTASDGDGKLWITANKKKPSP